MHVSYSLILSFAGPAKLNLHTVSNLKCTNWNSLHQECGFLLLSWLFLFVVGKYGMGSYKSVLGIGNAPRT